MDKPAFFYHIATPDEWHQFEHEKYYMSSSLASEGFIHGSTTDQIEHSMNLYYRGNAKILLLKIASAKLYAELKYELSPARNEYFPHIYGPLNKDAIVDIQEIWADRNGHFIFMENKL